jgi:hypothetical protein
LVVFTALDRRRCRLRSEKYVWEFVQGGGAGEKRKRRAAEGRGLKKYSQPWWISFGTTFLCQ